MKNKIQKTKMYTYHIKDMMFVGTCKKNHLKVALCIVFGIIALVVLIIPHVMTTHKYIHHRRLTRYATDLKYILFWSKSKHQRSRLALNKPSEFLPGQKMFINQKCPHINCYITYNKDTLNNAEDFDAIVFEIDDIIKVDVNFINLTRSPEQLYIFRSSETPEKHPLCHHDLDDFFNWTWTYKLSSDIPQPFLNIHYTNHSIIGPVTKMNWQTKKLKRSSSIASKIRHKKKAVAWVLTKCKLKTKHQDFIKEFKNEIRGYNYTLDIYGPCGKKKCPGGSAIKCYKMLEREYYFVIVLEEYLTEDYVTEVMVSAMSHLVIPIVLGPSDYSNFLPPGSFINVQAFDMSKLGALIDYLIKNPDMYEFFFDWKKYYYYTVRPRTQVCDLCTKLNEYNGSNVVKTNFRKWWDPEYKDVCQRMKLYKYFNTDV
ncbi:hypothetical protein B5X24_HaOG202743 [Helicoverpa armigera]|uniref:Fucosyltransferase n=1 Tax=Helicoverpa armigera TaxID=29058 RepID=A0A2W1BZ24_HELAM|nr:hypothetical protein B5X24_HaOG202743 [Helicoverpa armigera]